MSRERTRRDLHLALEAFYVEGKHTFWSVFDETPRAAVAAFLDRPETFGQIDPRLVGINQRRLRARVAMLAQLLAEQ